MMQLTVKQLKEIIKGLPDDTPLFAEFNRGWRFPIQTITVEHHIPEVIFKED